MRHITWHNNNLTGCCLFRLAIDGQLASAEDALVEALHIMPDEASLHTIDRRLADLAWALEGIRADLLRVIEV